MADINQNLKVLIVDDMMSTREMLKLYLKEIGYTNFQEAADGESALKMLIAEARINQPFELVISDINMPNMNGITLLSEVRSESMLKDVPFLIVSSENEKGTVMKAIQYGTSNYILKPFTKETLKEKILRIFD